MTFHGKHVYGRVHVASLFPMHKLLHRTHLCLRFLVNGELLLSSQRYGFKFIINSEAMSTHKRSAGASTENCTVKKSCSSHIDTNKHNLTPTEITQNRIDMQIMEKNELEILEAPDQSENDKKQYRVIRLGNGLKALLIYDPVAETKSIVDFSKCNVKVPTNGNEMVSTMALDDGDDESESESSDNEEDGDGGEAREKLAACSLSVDVGSFSDPRDVQGLAHFLGRQNHKCIGHEMHAMKWIYFIFSSNFRTYDIYGLGKISQ